jgi:glyoxylase-like metal-dependent hydrolase (beta-lactamase superfamily II)
MLPAHVTFVERGMLHSNSVVFHGRESFVLVDSGYHTGVDALVAAVESRARRPIGELATLLTTHVHPDHTGGHAALKARTGCTIVTSEIDRMLLESADPVTLMRDWAGLACPSFDATSSVRPGETIRAGASELVAIEASGHAAGELSFYSERDRLLVCGDLLWASGFSGVVPAVEGVGGLARHERSLAALRALDVAVALPGHGPAIVGRDAVRRRIDETIDGIRRLRASPERWARATLRQFLSMHVLVAGSVPRRALVASCARATWLREHATRYFGADDDAAREALVASLVSECVDRGPLRAVDGDRLVCALVP